MRILLLDDSPLVREAVSGLLARAFPGAAIEALGPLAEFRAPTDEPGPDLVIANVSGLPLAALAPLARAAAGTSPVAALDARARPERVEAARNAGCRGYIPLTVASDLIAAALALVAAGGEYYPAAIAPARPAETAEDAALPRLSARQRDVVRRLAEGKTNREIAGDLGIAVATVKLHVHAILSAIGARNRTEAALWARTAAAALDA